MRLIALGSILAVGGSGVVAAGLFLAPAWLTFLFSTGMAVMISAAALLLWGAASSG